MKGSMPQGDSLAPAVTNLVMSTPVKDILRRIPATQMCVFLDDRTWSSRTVQECAQVFQSWTHHTGLLGLQENETKTQSTHKSAAGRRKLEAHPRLK